MAKIIDIVVPDGVVDAVVIELMQQIGNRVAADESLLALETDKATAEVPAPATGKLLDLSVKIGDTLSSGAVIGKLEIIAEAEEITEVTIETKTETAPPQKPLPANVESASSAGVVVPLNSQSLGASVHASPAVRQFARELGVELSGISEPSGPKNRITFGDVKGFVKTALNERSSSATSVVAAGIPPIELPDFSQFGPIEEQKLGKIKQVSGEHLAKGWLNIPLVTHFEEIDITDLENFRQELNERKVVTKGSSPRATVLSFIVLAVVKSLQRYPQVNSSLCGKSLILKKYYNIGIAVDTPRGLLVPVIKGAEQLSLDDISLLLKELGSKGRAGKLGAADLKGGSFTISSLGGLGGTNFTPLINPPEAAILGVAKSALKPVWNGTDFIPRLILPFSLSYDHRILDGGEAARFSSALAEYLKDLRYLLL